MKITKLELSKIKVDKNQPRKDFKDIENLASSILKEGLLEPLKVRKEKDDYIVVDGERRFKALSLLAKEDKEYLKIDCIIISPKEVFITQLSTDLHKNRLDPFEEAEAFKKLLDEGWTTEDLKARLGIPMNIITRRIKLLGLDKKTKHLIKSGIISQSTITEIDFKSFKDNEKAVLSRIGNEIGFANANNSREKIRRIIKEETEKEEAIINHLRIDLENFSRVIQSYNFKLDDFKLDDFIGEPIKNTQKILYDTLWKVEQLIGIKERLLKVKKQLDEFKIKYGEKTEITKEIIKQKGGLNSSQAKNDKI